LQKDVKKSGRNQAIKTERSNSNEKKQKDKTKNNGNTNRSQDNLNETASSQRAMGYYQVYTPSYNIVLDVQPTKTEYTKEIIERMHCHPRPSPKYLGNRHKQRTPWDFKLSCFKLYIPDNESILSKCFELDWSRTKIDRLIKDEDQRETIKHICKKNYKWFRESYKYIAGMEPQNNVPCISNMIYSDTVQQMENMVDGKTLKLADLDLEFIATKA
jgi:hypothetical protein